MNCNYFKLSEQYLFAEVSKKIRERVGAINLSVGDVRLPLPPSVVEAGVRAAKELGCGATFKGYPPEAGYDFFLQAVVGYYDGRVKFKESEVFVSDGIKSELSAFLSVFKGKIVLSSPTYPAYIETNTILGNEIIYSDCPPSEHVDLVLLCSPANPTGEILTKEQLCGWVEYCRREKAILIFDAAYEAFSSGIRSIFEIDGARECAVEFCSLSKTAGFTGVRCGYTVICNENPLNAVWRRVKACLDNGVSYITQRMAECALTGAIDKIKANIRYYQENGSILAKALSVPYNGSPYIWYRAGENAFERLLNDYSVGVTPGVGFGKAGRDYVRINSFCFRSEAVEAAKRLKSFSEVNKNFQKILS